MRSSGNHGQVISYITNEDFKRTLDEIKSQKNFNVSELAGEYTLINEELLFEQGVFYLLMLEPDHDPGRFKVAFAINLSERLRALRLSLIHI